MAVGNVAPAAPCSNPPNAHAPLEETPSDEINDDRLVLSPDHVYRVAQFRHEIQRCKTDPEKYAVCVRMRNELLQEHTGVQLLAAACEHVMSTQCTVYKDWKARNKPPKRAKSEWDVFLGVATDGQEIKSKCLSALKTVARHWGEDVVQHYPWAYKGRKYCDMLRAAAIAVPDWKKAAKGLSLSMLTRFQQGMSLKRRQICASPNPIEQGDLKYLREHPPEDIVAISLPDGFGFDKFGLMVCKEYAAVLPEPDNAGAERPTPPEAGTVQATGSSAPDSTSTTDLQSPTASKSGRANSDGNIAAAPKKDTAIPGEGSGINATHDQPSTPPVTPKLNSTDCANAASHADGRTFRTRPGIAYRESLGGGRSKRKSAGVPEIPPPRCCPAEVPDTLLSVLDNPWKFGPETAMQFSPFIEKLCRPHLQVLAVRTSAIAFAEQANGTNRPVRRRASSLPDISQPDVLPKRPRLGEPLSLSTNTMTRPIHDRINDDRYRRQVLAELREKARNATSSPGSHGEGTDELVRKLLEHIKQPSTDSKCGAAEALFCTGDEARMLVESASPGDAPIITEGQQQLQWGKDERPIVQLFRRMGALEKTVSVQIPSRKSTTRSCEVRTMSEVRERFLTLDENRTGEPWNILDLQSPLPHSILPNFLTGENCQLLVQVRNTVLMGGSAERVAGSARQWDDWKNVLEWVLLSEGGHHIAPHTDSHGFATWITAQEGSIGFGWMSCPTEGERSAWMADPRGYTGGRWRYAVLKPGQSVFFDPGTIHFVFRVRGCQTLALGGHVLQWSDITRWMQVVLAQMARPAITNEDMKWSTTRLVRVVARLVAARIGAGELGDGAATEFFASVKVGLSPALLLGC
ncbi:hypothetical protein QBC40DRAFT_38091 [Triangularia verruculosa]|uniref:JmjC domain-containing protein n=1 Tax=Triangularia verruculosa TaxID=2587418 RepID=A0AAN6X5Y2_9PEZI|nr:hypothetical protein QBC40DRAFT_38091 [Triangularia verruculosa]